METPSRNHFRSKPSFHRALRYLAVSMILFSLALVVYANYTGLFDSTQGVEDPARAQDIEARRLDFHTSLAASALEDIVFFVTIGLAAFLLTLRKPEEESLEERIRFLFSGLHATEAARMHIKKMVNKHACISPYSTMDITIEKFEPAVDAFRVATEWNFRLANMYDNQPYIDKEVELELFMDDIDPPDGVYGQVQAIRTLYQDHASIDNHIQCPVNITELTHLTHVELELPPNGLAIYNTRFWHYSKRDGEYTLQVNRYTEELIITLTNVSGQTLYYKTTDDRQKPRHKLDDGQRVTVYSAPAKPEEQAVVLYLHTDPGEVTVPLSDSSTGQ